MDTCSIRPVNKIKKAIDEMVKKDMSSKTEYQKGHKLYTYDVLKATENAWNQYNSKPNALRQFYNNMNSAFDDWRRSMNGGF